MDSKAWVGGSVLLGGFGGGLGKRMRVFGRFDLFQEIVVGLHVGLGLARVFPDKSLLVDKLLLLQFKLADLALDGISFRLLAVQLRAQVPVNLIKSVLLAFHQLGPGVIFLLLLLFLGDAGSMALLLRLRGVLNRLPPALEVLPDPLVLFLLHLAGLLFLSLDVSLVEIPVERSEDQEANQRPDNVGFVHNKRFKLRVGNQCWLCCFRFSRSRMLALMASSILSACLMASVALTFLAAMAASLAPFNASSYFC